MQNPRPPNQENITASIAQGSNNAFVSWNQDNQSTPFAMQNTPNNVINADQYNLNNPAVRTVTNHNNGFQYISNNQQQITTNITSPIQLQQPTNDVISKYHSLGLNSFAAIPGTNPNPNHHSIAPSANIQYSSTQSCNVPPGNHVLHNVNRLYQSSVPQSSFAQLSSSAADQAIQQSNLQTQSQVPDSKKPKYSSHHPFNPSSPTFLRGNPEALYRERVKEPPHSSDINITNVEARKIETEIDCKLISRLSNTITDANHPDRPSTMISYYIGQSDRFVRLAYESSTIAGLENHNKFIILAIKMLLIVAKKYKSKLKPKQESIVYYRLGKLYLTETINIHKAEEYINKALDIANFHEFKQIRFYCELLLAQILETTNLKLCANYVFSKGQYYKQKGDHIYSNLFQLLRIKSLIISDCATALVVLQGSISDPDLNDSIKCLCLIYEANLHCYRGSPDIALKLLGEVEQLAYSDGDNPIMPVQVDGMVLLCRLTAYSNMNMVAEAESCRKLISNYIKAQTEEGWKSWNDNGIVRVEIDELDHDTTVPFLFRWLNSDEFVITYYLITGSTYMSHDGYSEKVFDKCLQMISDQKKRISNGGSKSLLSPREVGNRMLKLRYLQFTIAFYKTWIGFLKGKYKKITNMNVFMNENNSKFSSEEYSCFKPLLPLIYYMFAAFYQDKGDIQAAKYYYLKVRTMTSSNMSQETKKSPEQIINTSLFQLQLGIGCDALAAKGQFNELYVFSSIQLYILLEFQLTEIKQNVSNVKDQQMLEDHVNLKSELVQELRNIFKAKQTSNSFTVNFTGSNLMLTISYFLVSDILSETQEGDKSGIEPSLEASFHTGLKLLGKKTTFTLMHFLISNYILTKSSNMDQKERISEMVKEQVAQNGLNSPQSTPDLSKIIRVMLLEHLQKKYHSVGDLQNAKMAELQSSYYYKCLQDKFKFLFENTRYFDKGDMPVAKINSESPPTTSDSVERKQLDR